MKIKKPRWLPLVTISIIAIIIFLLICFIHFKLFQQ